MSSCTSNTPDIISLTAFTPGHFTYPGYQDCNHIGIMQIKKASVNAPRCIFLKKKLSVQVLKFGGIMSRQETCFLTSSYEFKEMCCKMTGFNTPYTLQRTAGNEVNMFYSTDVK